MHRPRIWSLLLALLISLLMGSASAWAHSATIEEPYLMELGQSLTVEHSDQDDWKGTLTLTVTNTGEDAWGDFHFYLPENGDVYFGESASITSGVSDYDFDFSLYALDFYFYDDPVTTGESLTFELYTDNTTGKLSLFGISMEASPVPVPSAVWLLGAGLIGLIGIRRRQR